MMIVPLDSGLIAGSRAASIVGMLHRGEGSLTDRRHGRDRRVMNGVLPPVSKKPQLHHFA
ncbi:hypothetical protein RLDS_07480 [Sphingobium lactosutens DS20]|uniref:Uncharacterized protein n=1 Tax=Sphingobium lactosutens DS20 TaxID=1331060 RepID=T0HU43_9SPHN|nr:hypothetical protein RLDS_07480 [Sphingobium lactosutens DS20]